MAIHELCRTKSAMMCLIVRTSIHPTSASTGTEDDMWGNDKADALAGTVWSRTDGGVGRNLFSNSDPFGRFCRFMTFPGPECTSANSKKCGLWPRRDMAPNRLPVGAICTGTDIVNTRAKCSFTDIYDRPRLAADHPASALASAESALALISAIVRFRATCRASGVTAARASAMAR